MTADTDPARPADDPRITRRFLLAYSLGGAGLFALWLVGAYALLPRLVRSAYEGTSVGFLNGLISGQRSLPVEYYLDRAAALAHVGTIGLAATLVAGFFAWRHREPLARGFRWVVRMEPRGSGRETALLAATLGVAFGVLESGAAWIRFRSTGIISANNNPDVLWMAPLTLGVLFALFAVLAYVVLGSARRGLSQRLVVAVLATLGWYGAIRGLRLGLHPAAVWLLSTALGIQLARLLAARPGWLHRLRRTAAPAGASLALVALFFTAGGRMAERRAWAALPDPGEGPNILLIVLDTVRGESTSLHGYGRPTTPEIARRAAEGVAFDRAFASSPWTLPTHATLFTGRWDHELSVDWEMPLDDEFPTLAEVLSARGYATAGFVANLGNAAATTGLDRGFQRYSDHARTIDGWLVSALVPRRVSRWIWPRLSDRRQTVGRKYAPSVNREFLEWLDRTGDRPFFAFLNYFDAHAPYEIHREYLERFPEEPPQERVTDEEGEPHAISPQLRRAIDGYDTSLALIDEAVGRLFAELESRGLLDNTVVVVTSDHGEHLGNRGLMDHGNSLYSQLLLVPLTIRYPGRVPAGRRIARPVSLRDVPATILDLAGVDPGLPGRSLAPLWAGEPGEEARLVLAEVSAAPHDGLYEGPTSYGPMQSLVSGRYHYIRNGDGTEELYDVVADPAERTDLSDTEAGRVKIAELRPRLTRAIASELASHALVGTRRTDSDGRGTGQVTP